MMKFISSFFLQILPSVIATVLGAYIVNHYINPKSDSGAPKAAYSDAAATPEQASNKAGTKASPAKPAAASDTARVIPDRAIPDKANADRATAEKAAAEKVAAEKAASEKALADKAAVEAKHPNPRERVVRGKPAPVVEPAASVAAAPAGAGERRDANELARAAIDRLRGSTEARPADPPRASVVTATSASGTSAAATTGTASTMGTASAGNGPSQGLVQPLPPPVVVAAPVQGPVSAPRVQPLQSASSDGTTVGERRRMVPPADIPAAPPIDLSASAQQAKTNMAEDMLSAARSVINSVVPQ